MWCLFQLASLSRLANVTPKPAFEVRLWSKEVWSFEVRRLQTLKQGGCKLWIKEVASFEARRCSEKIRILFSFKSNWIWLWSQFSFRFCTKWKSIWFQIEMKTVTTIISHSIGKEIEYEFSQCMKLWTKEVVSFQVHIDQYAHHLFPLVYLLYSY